MEDKTSGSTAVEAAETNAAPAKKTAKPKSKAQKAKSSHPPTSEMVTAAIKELKDRKGSSLQAIKKYIVSTYKVDGEKVAPFIKRYLKAAVVSGTVVQTKGKGASGSFKLPAAKTSEGKPKVQRPVKKVEAKKQKIWVEKKTTAQIRKPAAAKKSSPVKKAAEEAPKKVTSARKPPAKVTAAEKAKAAAAEAKAMPKAKKTAKAPAAKTKTPKPKRAAASKTAKATAKK